MFSLRRAFMTPRSKSAPARRDRRGSSHRSTGASSARAGSLALEPLEPRTMLAVTVNVVGTELQIALGAANDTASLAKWGEFYQVEGTGLTKQYVYEFSAKSVSVTGSPAANQSFTVKAGGANVSLGLNVASSVEKTEIAGAVSTSGAVQINSAAITLAADVTTQSGQAFGGAVAIVGTRKLVALFLDSVIFKGTVDSSGTPAAGLTVTAFSGVIEFAAPVGGVKPLASLTTSSGLRNYLSSVTTIGTQDYRSDGVASGTVLNGTYTTTANGNFRAFGQVYLAGDTTVSTGTGTIRFGRGVDGACSLTVNSTGTKIFSDVVGGLVPLAMLTSSAGGSTSLKSVTTTGRQDYFGPVVLDGNYNTIDKRFRAFSTVSLAGDTSISTGSGNIRFDGTVDGAKSLSVYSKVNTTFAAVVGGTTPLESLQSVAGVTSIKRVTTTKYQYYVGPITLLGG